MCACVCVCVFIKAAITMMGVEKCVEDSKDLHNLGMKPHNWENCVCVCTYVDSVLIAMIQHTAAL